MPENQKTLEQRLAEDPYLSQYRDHVRKMIQKQPLMSLEELGKQIDSHYKPDGFRPGPDGQVEEISPSSSTGPDNPVD